MSSLKGPGEPQIHDGKSLISLILLSPLQTAFRFSDTPPYCQAPTSE